MDPHLVDVLTTIIASPNITISSVALQVWNGSSVQFQLPPPTDQMQAACAKVQETAELLTS